MRRRPRYVLLLTLLFLTASCASRPPLPIHEPLAAVAERRPVVLVPGITGVALRHAETGRLAWGNGARLLNPRDGAYGLARSLSDPEADVDLEPVGVIEEIRLSLVSKDIYGPILRLLEAHGYRRGDTLLPFAYDWRQDNEDAVRRLYRELQELRRARGVERLEVDLICQSNGAHICRYLAKYGNATFAEAAAGRGGLPPELRVRKVILVGSSNGGGLRILRMLDRGRRYVPLAGRRYRPEVLFTFPSLYQDLPSYRERYFLDDDGRELEIDLYDPSAWETHGWSIFDDDARRRAARRPDLFGGVEEWRGYLEETLERARLFQRLLASDPSGFDPPRYYLIQNPADPTPDRAVLRREDDDHGDGWQLLFTGDRELARRTELLARVTAPGDGHATFASQMHLSPRETAALAAEPTHVDGDHFELFLAPESLRRLLEILHEGDG